MFIPSYPLESQKGWVLPNPSFFFTKQHCIKSHNKLLFSFISFPPGPLFSPSFPPLLSLPFFTHLFKALFPLLFSILFNLFPQVSEWVCVCVGGGGGGGGGGFVFIFTCQRPPFALSHKTWVSSSSSSSPTQD